MEEQTNANAEMFMDLVNQARQLMERIIEAEVNNKIMATLPKHVFNDFELLEIYTQTAYLANALRGEHELAIIGLQTAIRAVFLYGYSLAQQRKEDTRLTPLLGKFDTGVLQ